MTSAGLNPSSSRQGEGDLVLSLDASTTACKCIVWDLSGKPLAEGRGSIQLNSPSPLGFEQDAEAWWSATVQAVRAAVSQVNPARVRGMCIANQRETFVVADRSGRPLRPAIVWMDERCRDQVAAVRQRGEAPRLHAITGKPASVTPSFYKILWLREQEPDLFDGAPLVLDVHGFLVLRLTGRFRTSLPSADPLGLVDMQAGDWSPEVLALAGLDREQVPEIVPAGSEIGVLTEQAANVCGLPAGLPVLGGAGDGQAAGLGAGLRDPRRAYLNLGTAVVSGVFSAGYRTSMAFRTMAGAAPGTYILETDLKGGTFTVNWLVDHWLDHEGPPSQILKRLETEAQSLPAGAQGLVLVPYWNGVMNPYWDDDATGLVMGWRECHGPAHLYRAILEGIAFEQRLQTSAVERATGSPVEELVVMGGGATSDLWCQIVADVTGKCVRRAGSTEATSLGVAILAAWGTGLYPDLSSAVEGMTSVGDAFEPGPNQPRYDRMYLDVYQGLFEAVRPQMDRLARHLREG
jgi:sugar (pentulose or hexulose) kinase